MVMILQLEEVEDDPRPENMTPDDKLRVTRQLRDQAVQLVQLCEASQVEQKSAE